LKKYLERKEQEELEERARQKEINRENTMAEKMQSKASSTMRGLIACNPHSSASAISNNITQILNYLREIKSRGVKTAVLLKNLSDVVKPCS